MSEMIRIGDPQYPISLLPFDNKPEQLYYSGELSLLESRCIAICGSRKCTPYGVEITKRIASAAARAGLTVVSGMARGIDAVAHRSALSIGGKTIAVLGCGVDVCYPRSNRPLYREILEKGLILSEYPDGAPPVQWQFPQRNRIISGICEAVVITEASGRSGALITAEHALEQNKEVYAVPGSILSENSMGCNKLIQEGAILLTDPGQVLRDMSLDPVNVETVLPLLGEDEKTVYGIVARYGSVTMNRLYAETLLAPQMVNGLVTLLEIKGLVVTSMDEVYISKIDVDTTSELWKNYNE